MAPKYVQRIARLPEVFDLLAAHPEGVALSTLAEHIGVPPAELREDLLAFYAADVKTLFLGLSRPSVLEFLGPDGDDEDPNTAEIVRMVDERAPEELGVEYVDASELALIYTAARALLDLEPNDEALVGAVAVLTDTMLGGEIEQDEAVPPSTALEPLQRAVADRRSVTIAYSRSWGVGAFERTIDPYRLVQTRRGWEVDAGPPDSEGKIRTYLLSNIASVTPTTTSYAEPAGLAAMLAEQRETSRVRVRVPHEARWAADFYAEQVTTVAADELNATLDLELLPPLGPRVGRLLLACGPDAVVLDPPGLVVEAPKLAAALLEHHRA
ncbi:MAG: helix-turn-helix transcriptional regulator [Marmoricola sp.]